MVERRTGTDRRSPALGGRRSTDHGTRAAYQAGCRCVPCVEAQAAYHARYAKGLIPGWVSGDAARAHLAKLRAAGVGLDRVSVLAGVSRRTLCYLARGDSPQIHADTARRILAVTQPTLADGAIVSQSESYATRERLRRIIEEQFPLPWLRARVGRHAVTQAMQRKGRGETGARVRVKTWKRVTALAQRLLFDESANEGATC